MMYLILFIYLSTLKPGKKFICSKINIYYLIGISQKTVRHTFFYFKSGNITYNLADTFQMLYINCSYYTNTCIQYIENVLPTFGMDATFNIGMCQFIDYDNFGMNG